MEKEYLIAYDIGTSGTKASLFSTDGTLISSDTKPYEVYFGSGGRAEQDPEDWWNAVVAASRKILGKMETAHIRAVSFSGQMMGCVLVDQNGSPLRRAIIWSDTRAKEEERELKEKLGEDRGYRLMGHRISCSYSIEKLMWIKKHEPQVYTKTYKMLQAKDYIILKMTGAFVSDYSDASGTNGMDINKLCWSREILELAGIDLDKMPQLHRSADIAGALKADSAALLGLPAGIPVVLGGGDGPCATLGAGCVEDKQYYLTFGTSAWIGGTTKDVFLDAEKVLFTFAHVIPGYYAPTGTMQAAGASYSYMKKTFFSEEEAQAGRQRINPYNLLNKLAQSSPVGAKNLLYLPYPTGERAPRWNPMATASFMGITMEHTKADYIRAVLEGVAMNLAVILRAHRKYADIHRLILTGGGAKGDIVARILSDVLGCEMIRPNHVEEATSMAAAVLAGIGAGIYEDERAIGRFLKFEKITRPIQENKDYYQKRIRVFDDCYEAMTKVYAKVRGE